MTGQGATSGATMFAQSATAAREAGLGPVRHTPETGSTNTDLVTEARRGDTSPCVLVADHQRAGRGRLDRTWEDRPGRALLVSLRLTTTAPHAHEVVAAVAAGARAAIDELLPVSVEMKWPNDLVVRDGPRPGKLAGVLAEFVDGAEPVVVVGLGCNVDPIDSQPGSTSLTACGAWLGRDEVLARILRRAGERFGDPDRVRDDMRNHSATLATRVRVDVAERRAVIGTAVDFDDEGRLVVDADDGTRHIIGSGDVVSLRPES